MLSAIVLLVAQNSLLADSLFLDEQAFLAAAGQVSSESFEQLVATNTFNLQEVVVDAFSMTGGEFGVFSGPQPNGTHPTNGQQFIHAQGFNSSSDLTISFLTPSNAFGVTITDLEDCPSCGTNPIIISTNTGASFTILEAGAGVKGSELFVGLITSSEAYTTITLGGFSGFDAFGIDGAYYKIQNQVPNATFDTTVDGWSVVSGAATAEWSPLDADNLPGSGSLRLHHAFSCGLPCTSVAQSDFCLRATDGDEYLDEWKVFVPFVGTEVGVSVELNFYGTPDCSDTALAGVNKCFGIHGACFPALPQGSWQTVRINDFEGTPPPGTTGAKLLLTLTKENTELPVSAHLDNIYFSPADQRSYVALGDSFASGEGTFTYGPESGACHRSPRAYPETSDVQGGEELAQRFYACSGATTRNILPTSLGGEPQNSDPSGATQLDRALIGNARLVTLGVGGNDAHFKLALWRMFLHPDAFGRTIGALTYRVFLDLNIRTVVRARFAEVLSATISAAPSDAVVLVIGYPQVFPAGSSQLCGDLLLPSILCPSCSFSPDEQDTVRSLTTTLNSVLEDVAAEHNVYFVPVAQYFEEHEVCGGDPTTGSWINPLVGLGEPESFHPNSLGHWYGYKPAIEDFVASMGGLNAMAEEAQSRQTTVTRQTIEQASGPTIDDLTVGPAGAPACDGNSLLAAGEDIHVSGEGFQGSSSVDLRLLAHGSTTSLGSLLADGSGGIDGVLTIPLSAADAPMALVEAEGIDSEGFVRLLEGAISVGDPVGQDSDADGVPDVCDVCPSTSDPMQLDGDGDGHGDACDVCPGDPENDVDQDGLCADQDPCPLDPANDADGDGLCAEVDPCPFFPNPPSGPCELVFAAGFETGDTSRWSLSVP